MIRARLQMGRGRKGLFLGLTGENVARLVAGEPIVHPMEDVGFPNLDLVMIYGKTDDDAKNQLAQLAGLSEAPPQRTVDS